eukprot:CAMPEP_0181220138 /NCGR_PEP_ID=MMETSP1096-20121128/28671_1 /TAXON_ID=156174 ORGANISM="Chrysochromulina ericina, Strain CCMP281" /NCGR_SAMPLE_ID=MMETSP1096 /ASSEMBLY_ACC=CAM_ASM_000453 /LENGTH=92 /DNA_ID=CAMNT_0023312609 /DNA_START=278 /DNA_END=552 /DNA_ORIENTATION=+
MAVGRMPGRALCGEQKCGTGRASVWAGGHISRLAAQSARRKERGRREMGGAKVGLEKRGTYEGEERSGGEDEENGWGYAVCKDGGGRNVHEG